LRNEDEEADEAVAVGWADEVADTAAGAEGLSAGLVAGSPCAEEVSEGCGLFFPEEIGDSGEGGLGIVRTGGREPRTRGHLLMEEFCGDCGRELRFYSPDQINSHDKITQYV
jgi:hypothetical protein